MTACSSYSRFADLRTMSGAQAVVARDDGAAGLFLRFREISKTATANLDKLLASLPIVETKPPDGPGVVVSEVIERR